MGFILFFLFFLLLIPLLVVGSTVLKLVFGVRAAFQPKNETFFTKKGAETDGSSNSNTNVDDGSIGHSELGKKRLNVLKNRATDVQYDEIEGNS